MTETEKEQAKDKLQDSVQEDGAEEEMEVSAVNTAEDNNSNIGIGKHDHPDQTEKAPIGSSDCGFCQSKGETRGEY